MLVPVDQVVGLTRSTAHTTAPQKLTFHAMRRVIATARVASGSSANAAFDPNTSSIAIDAGHPGHAHGPYHASKVMAIPASAAMNPRLMRTA